MKEIKTIAIKDRSYPEILKEISSPPQVLYTRGKLELKKDELTLAVVGTRRCSNYGRQITEEIVVDLVNYGFTIISGMARGIDSYGHRACLERNGKTIAVLGSGIDEKSIYPQENIKLARQIIESGGAVISEFPPGTPSLPHHFPQRNRIIAGLSLGTLVIEAPEKSGALITANFALEQNREVFAVPGSIYSRASRGPNNLIKIGAKAVTCMEDILEEFNLPVDKQNLINQQNQNLNLEEQKIFQCLSIEPLHIDKIIEKTKLNAPTTNSTLTMMELKGVVKNLGSNVYTINF